MRLSHIILPVALWAALSPRAFGASPAADPGPPPTDYTLAPVVDPAEAGQGPARIVSIAPSITEMCAALGMADRIVGRTQYCTHPPEVLQAAVVGAYGDTNYEKIVALQPELILITENSPKIEEVLKGLKLPYVTVPDSSLEDIYAAAARVGEACGRPNSARMLIGHLKNDLEVLRDRAGGGPSLRVLFTHVPLPPTPGSVHAAGPGGYLDSLLEMAGHANALAGIVNEPWANISVETIIRARPDVILEVRPGGQATDLDALHTGWSALQAVPAIGRRQIRSLTSRTVFIPGPRVNIVLHDIIRALRS